MFWNEKIDRLSSRFSPGEFKDPFYEGPEILKKIEKHFVIKTDSLYPLRNWEHLKGSKFIGQFTSVEVASRIGQLDNNNNYWLVVTMGNGPTGKLYVYDCSPRVIDEMLTMVDDDFYIVHKKYQWLIYFKKESNNVFNVYKSGEMDAPF